MTDFVKQQSDRPDIEETLEHVNGRTVDLSDADDVFVEIWVGLTRVVEEPATVVAPSLGLVSYDLHRTDLDVAGDALVEFRVEWDDGDHEWFPTDERGFELTVVAPPGPRTGQPATGGGILRVGQGETHVVDGVEEYSRIENGGTIRIGPDDVLRT